ncbi:MAG: hypothetical protein WBL68_08565 [Nitrososphaeraceae archaeon]
MLEDKFTKSELIYLLVSADKKNAVVVAPGAYWPSNVELRCATYTIL